MPNIRNLSAPLWTNCYNEPCSGEIREFQVVSIVGASADGTKPAYTIYRCVECGAQGKHTAQEIENLTGTQVRV
jgi:hypothetical protein